MTGAPGPTTRARARAAACAGLLGVLSLVVAAPVGAEDGGGRYLPDVAAAEVGTLRQRVAGTRQAVAEGTFTGRIRGLLGEGSATLEVAVPSEPETAGLAFASLAPTIAPAVADLASAVTHASRLVGTHDPADLHAAWTGLVASLDDRVEQPRRVVELPGLSAPVLHVTDERGRPLPLRGGAGSRSVHAAPPAGPAVQAALLLGAALDRVMPALEVAAEQARGGGRAVDGCDVLERLPLLCVGSERDNTYTAGAALLIDLGGHDTYRNGAGSAPVAGGSPVALSVDLGGDDRYEAVADDTLPGLVHGAGTGVLGGVGILVDVAGADRYEAVAAEGSRLLVTQGAGLTAGVGLLLDLDGDDDYRAVLPAGDHDTMTVVAQGGSVGCGRCDGEDQFAPAVGGLLDLGGADRYRIAMGLVRQTAVGTGMAAGRRVVGQGGGGYWPATGVLVDSGGADEFLVDAAWQGLLLDRFPAEWPAALEIPTIQVVAQGAGSSAAGTGLLLAGAGRTRYSVAVTGQGLGMHQVYVQGVGNFVSDGVLDDRGGDDRYDVRTVMRYDRTIVVDDACRTGSERCTSAVAAVSGTHNSPGIYSDGNFPSRVYAQGGGFYEGSGLLEDHDGDDTYTVDTQARMDVVLDDRLSAPSAPASLEVTSFDSPLLQAQATSVLGFGALVDHGGTDSYTARSVDATTAEARSENAMGGPSVVVRTLPTIFTHAQGADAILGHAALLDLGSAAGDRFLVEVEKPTVAVGNPDGAYVAGCCWFARAHGTGGGGVFVAEGAAPAIRSTQSRPVPCPAAMRRGFGTWRECGATTSAPSQQGIDGMATAGTGQALGAAGSAPTLAVTDDTPSAATESSGRLPVGATLRDATGAPVAGALVRFDLQVRNPPAPVDVQAHRETEEVWANLYEVEALTGPDGVARARLPLLLGGASAAATAAGSPFRVMASYDGATASGTTPASYPAHVAKPLDLSP